MGDSPARIEAITNREIAEDREEQRRLRKLKVQFDEFTKYDDDGDKYMDKDDLLRFF